MHSGCWDSEFLDIFLISAITLPSPECAIQQILLKIKGSLNYSHVHLYIHDIYHMSSFPRFLLDDVGCPCPLFRLKSTYATSEAARGIGTWTNAYETCEKDKDAKAFTMSLALNLNLKNGDAMKQTSGGRQVQAGHKFALYPSSKKQD